MYQHALRHVATLVVFDMDISISHWLWHESAELVGCSLLIFCIMYCVSIVVLQGYELPGNIVATTSAGEAIEHAQYAVHAVPVQHSREFLAGIVVSPPILPS